MPNYQNGKIYRLVSNKTEDVYYGSTVEKLSVRKSKHKCDKTCISRKLFENDAIVTIILVEEFHCNSKMELEARELFYITNNPCINNNKPFISELNYGIEYQKEYREANKESVKEYVKKYYETNKEALLEQKKNIQRSQQRGNISTN